jgi:hypothetical protein
LITLSSPIRISSIEPHFPSTSYALSGESKVETISAPRAADILSMP